MTLAIMWCFLICLLLLAGNLYFSKSVKDFIFQLVPSFYIHITYGQIHYFHLEKTSLDTKLFEVILTQI